VQNIALALCDSSYARKRAGVFFCPWFSLCSSGEPSVQPLYHGALQIAALKTAEGAGVLEQG
jgi:hypothetical protein